MKNFVLAIVVVLGVGAAVNACDYVSNAYGHRNVVNVVRVRQVVAAPVVVKQVYAPVQVQAVQTVQVQKVVAVPVQKVIQTQVIEETPVVEVIKTRTVTKTVVEH